MHRQVAEAFGQVLEETTELTTICGSPGEVANDPALGHRFKISVTPVDDGSLSLLPNHFYAQSQRSNNANIMANLAVYAGDQLRHRVAFALSQIFVVAKQLISDSSTEPYAYYYDILLRNAFGSIRNIYREVSYSPIMAR